MKASIYLRPSSEDKISPPQTFLRQLRSFFFNSRPNSAFLLRKQVVLSSRPTLVFVPNGQHPSRPRRPPTPFSSSVLHQTFRYEPKNRLGRCRQLLTRPPTSQPPTLLLLPPKRQRSPTFQKPRRDLRDLASLMDQVVSLVARAISEEGERGGGKKERRGASWREEGRELDPSSSGLREFQPLESTRPETKEWACLEKRSMTFCGSCCRGEMGRARMLEQTSKGAERELFLPQGAPKKARMASTVVVEEL